jgi:uncharacterized membrane protein
VSKRFQGLFAVLLSISYLFPNQSARGANPVVRALLFYSPLCSHCHEVIDNVLPPLVEEYGSSLEIIGIDITLEEGSNLFRAAITSLQIPADRAGFVPTLIVGSSVFIGTDEIAQEFPGVIQEGLSAGIDLPAIDGLDDLIETGSTALVSFSPAPASTEQKEPAPTAAAQTTPDKPDEAEEGIFSIDRMKARFNQDPLANGVAVGMLVVMIASLVYAGYRFLSDPGETAVRMPPDWLIPALSVTGAFIAFYLTFVEVTGTEAVCGPVGDCNSVQTSPYSRVLGFLPVGLLGLLGYLGILAAYVLQVRGPLNLRNMAALAVWGMVVFGLLFTIYLTFLEPFVIGATCAWCIASAVVMTLLLWLTTPGALNALNAEPAG